MRPYRGLTKDGKWKKGYLISPNRIMVWDKDVCMRSESYQVIPETVGQSTGLHDKNDKEIFEGDIVKYSIDDHEQSSPYEIKDMTEWFQKMYDSDEYYRWDEDSIEVIGNIHSEEQP